MSSPTIKPWMAFIAKPTARRWYRAHNASIVAAYLEHRELAETESRPERFFLNVVLLRVLYQISRVPEVTAVARPRYVGCSSRSRRSPCSLRC